MTSSQVALQVVQQAISVLAKWANADLPTGCQAREEHSAVTRAKKIFSWSESTSLNWLRLLFDAVKLPDGKGQGKQHYHPAKAIANSDPLIPYPQLEPPTSADEEDLKTQIREALTGLDQLDWQNLSLLTVILEKFGSCLSFGELDVALIDMVRTTGAIAAALASHPEASELTLVAGDLSGIQKFIYTISSDGALKSLRARSFYLEIVTEEVVQQLLTALDLPRTSVIYAGGGNLYLLAAATPQIGEKVQQVQQYFNNWLKDNLQRKVYLTLDYLIFKIDDVSNPIFATHWNQVIQKLNKQKSRKFSEQIDSLLEPRESFRERCRVCHRDDTLDLKQLNRQEYDSVQACPSCRDMFHLGSQLFKSQVFLRSERECVQDYLEKVSFQSAHYYLFEKKADIQDLQEGETLFLLNNWTLNDYRFHNCVPLLLGKYGKESKEEKSNFIRAIEMANKAEGIKRVGYLRMDVDNLGKIFAKGLNENHTLPRLAGLSRQMSYFFKVYLNSLASSRQDNFLKYSTKFKYLTEDSRTNLLFIYAGGDDLFVSGVWNEVVEFAFDVYQSFRAYTGNNPDITLSGGVSIAPVKYPLYQAAEESGEAEKAAKGNGRDSLSLFGEKFKWNEWLGEVDVSAVESREQDYWKKVEVPGVQQLLLGVFPFVRRINLQRLSPSYSRSFVRNLLNAAQLQDRMIGEIKDKRKQQQYDYQIQDIQYYLHLPQIAYTLARLPREKFNDDEFRKSLKSPYNAPYFRAIATWVELLTRPSNK